MKVLSKQAGFSAVEVVLVLAVIAVLAVVGVRVVGNSNSSDGQSSQTSSTSSVSTSKAPEVNNTSDLDKASAVLDQNDPATTNAADSKSLDSDLSALN